MGMAHQPTVPDHTSQTSYREQHSPDANASQSLEAQPMDITSSVPDINDPPNSDHPVVCTSCLTPEEVDKIVKKKTISAFV